MNKGTVDPLASAAWLKESYELLEKLNRELYISQIKTKERRFLEIQRLVGTTAKLAKRTA
jgi:hypothetical protein